MKIEQFGNSYRVRKMVEGKSFCVSFDHKPTDKEVTLALAKRMSEFKRDVPPGTVKYFSKKYMEKLKTKGKSPTTIRSYKSIQNNTPDWFLKRQLSDVTSDDLKNLVKEYGEDHSSKSVRNLYGFYRTVLDEYREGNDLTIELPPKDKKAVYEPSTKDIKAILEYAEGTRYELFLKLASIGLRRGEIAALTSADLDSDNILTINKDMIVDEHNNSVIKNCPKTSASNRRILIPKETADLLREKGVAFDGNMHTINEYLHKAQDALNIPRFCLHTMRHFAAAYLVKMGFTKNQILEYCGWEKGSSVMERVYAYNLDPEDSQKDIASAFKGLY